MGKKEVRELLGVSEKETRAARQTMSAFTSGTLRAEEVLAEFERDGIEPEVAVVAGMLTLDGSPTIIRRGDRVYILGGSEFAWSTLIKNGRVIEVEVHGNRYGYLGYRRGVWRTGY